MDTQHRTVNPIVRAAAAVVAAWIGGGVGLPAGGALMHFIAHLGGLDSASLKDALIWSILTGAVAGAIGGIWVVLRLTRASRDAQTITAIMFAVVTIGGAALTIAASQPPKMTGKPNLDYQVKLPAGFPPVTHDDVIVSLHSEQGNNRCSVVLLSMDGDRQTIAGGCWQPDHLPSSTMSLLYRSGPHRPVGYWGLPDAQPEEAFGTWHRIEIMPAPGTGAAALPGGEYDIRFRVPGNL
jgi:hypothetical protein